MLGVVEITSSTKSVLPDSTFGHELTLQRQLSSPGPLRSRRDLQARLEHDGKALDAIPRLLRIFWLLLLVGGLRFLSSSLWLPHDPEQRWPSPSPAIIFAIPGHLARGLAGRGEVWAWPVMR